MVTNRISEKNEFSRAVPTLFIVATPIGNLKDISLRALEVLKSVDVILCEDTRVTQKLLLSYNITTKCSNFDDHASPKAIEKCINMLHKGAYLALVSDAGTPLISDPGYLLIKAAKQHGIKIESIPGACSIINALILSGLKTQNFTFLGFLSHEQSAKRKLFEKYKEIESTLIFFESSKRMLATLELAKEIFTNANACIAREMTKRFEEVTNGTLEELIEIYSARAEIKGEIVVLIENCPNYVPDQMKLEEIITALLKQNLTLKEVVAEVSTSYKVPKNLAYDLALKVKADL